MLCKEKKKYPDIPSVFMFVKFFNVFIKAVYLLNLFECIIVCSNNDIHIFSREFLWTEVKMVDYSDIRGIRYNRASE